MDFLRIQLISGEEVTLSADDFVNLVERPGFLSVTALKQHCSSQLNISIYRQRLVYKEQVLKGEIALKDLEFPAELQLLLVPLVAPDGKTRERFFDAALRGEELILKSLLDEAIDPDTTDAFENTALHFAVGSSHVNVVRLLLEASADKDKVTLQRRNWTPLNFAAYAGDPDVLRLLLEARANPNGASLPLRQAVKMGHVAAAQMLLDAGSKIVPDQSQRSESESSSDSESESMQLTATRMGNTEILRLLLEARANPDEKTHGASPLLAAAQQGHVAAAELLLQFGADKNQMAMMPSGKSKVPRTALSAACHTGRIGVVRLLLSVGANKDRALDKEDVPLTAAARAGRTRVVDLLLQAGDDLNKAIVTHQSPLCVTKKRRCDT